MNNFHTRKNNNKQLQTETQTVPFTSHFLFTIEQKKQTHKKTDKQTIYV